MYCYMYFVHKDALFLVLLPQCRHLVSRTDSPMFVYSTLINMMLKNLPLSDQSKVPFGMMDYCVIGSIILLKHLESFKFQCYFFRDMDCNQRNSWNCVIRTVIWAVISKPMAYKENYVPKTNIHNYDSINKSFTTWWYSNKGQHCHDT